MVDRGLESGTGRIREVWPVLVLLILTVVVPTACVLWFMSEAIDNERLAVRQRLRDAYRGQLGAIRTRLQSSWAERAEAMQRIERDRTGPEVFAEIVGGDLADSVILYDAEGRAVYPTAPTPSPARPEEEGPEWARARDLEYVDGDPAAAADTYARIGRETTDPDLSARALQAEGRCRAKAGQTGPAIEILAGELGDDRYRRAVDDQGRLIQPSALLRGLQLMADPAHPRYRTTADRLQQRLRDYGPPSLPSSQRRFLMREAQETIPDCRSFPTLAAEEMASRYLDLHPTPSDDTYWRSFTMPESGRPEGTGNEMPLLRPSRLRHLWQFGSSEEGVVALFTEERILSEVETMGEDQALPPDMKARILPPGRDPDPSTTFVSLNAGRPLPGWLLILDLEDPALFDRSAYQQRAAYLWMGVLFIVVIVGLAMLMGRYVGRQMRLARLKNDLVATVSHELKTPLSSIRMLADTLLDGLYRDQGKTREYLQLIASENARLTRLIDNFLTFSRMERDKTSFEFAPVDPAEIAEAALAATRERFEAAGFRLETEIAPGLPAILADSDALTTVLLNLLDNAHKYSQDEKRVTLLLSGGPGGVSFEVEDSGIGMTARAVRRIFDRFYQVDQSLSRRAGGCGLGLSIVKFIVEAHGGSIEVASQPGRGSKFTVHLPVARSRTAGSPEGG